MDTPEELVYAGFWVRVGASLIDAVLLLMITLPPLYAIYGENYMSLDGPMIAGWEDFVLSWVVPAVLTVWLWRWKAATPGKMAISARIVDATTGAPISLQQSFIRYLGYFVSLLPLGLGIFWVGWDKRKQGWHDMMAGTVVVRDARRGPLPVTFKAEQ